MHAARESTDPVDLVTFFGLQFHPRSSSLLDGQPCGAVRCLVLHWLLQVQALATAIGRQLAQPTSVHMLATCLRPSMGPLLSQLGGAPVRVLSPAPELAAALQGLRRLQEGTQCCPGWTSEKALTLLKWQAVSLTGARLVVLLDLDVEVLPYRIARGEAYVAAVAADWVAVILCSLRGSAQLLGWPDHDAPFNAAMALIRPSRAMYDEGVRVLQRAQFNGSHGWDGVGPPSLALPASDAAWHLLPGKLGMLNRDDWRFVHASLDQGFFFYMFRVRRVLGGEAGGDLRLTRCARRGGGAAQLHHYVTGSKPQTCVRQLGCRSLGRPRPPVPVRQMFASAAPRRAGEALSPPKPIHATFVARSLGWVGRAAADLAALAAALNASSSSALAALSAAAVATVPRANVASRGETRCNASAQQVSGYSSPSGCTDMRGRADVAACAVRLRRTAGCAARGMLKWEARGAQAAALRRLRRQRGAAKLAGEGRGGDGVTAAEWMERLLGPPSPERGMPGQSFAEARHALHAWMMQCRALLHTGLVPSIFASRRPQPRATRRITSPAGGRSVSGGDGRGPCCLRGSARATQGRGPLHRQRGVCGAPCKQLSLQHK